MAEQSHDHAPGLPTVHDEAGDSPLWLPIVGLVLLLLALSTFVWREAQSAAEELAPPAALEAPAEPTAAPDAPAPSPDPHEGHEH